jgi:mRNA interferase MazF
MLEAGTVVLIPFPYSDLTAQKKRPVLMLTRPDGLGDFIGMPITSKPQPSPAIALQAGPLSEYGALLVASWIKTDTVFTLCETQVLKSLGKIAEAERLHCVSQLCRYLNKG